MNITERAVRVLAVIVEAKGPVELGWTGKKAFPDLPSTQANSWVRNQLRVLIERGLARKTGPGTYEAI